MRKYVMLIYSCTILPHFSPKLFTTTMQYETQEGRLIRIMPQGCLTKMNIPYYFCTATTVADNTYDITHPPCIHLLSCGSQSGLSVSV
mmetsp:Transcript_38105/g.56239  ORF Transcript_38105/g.56239 Transcript_38105/m.56239 type:complete len:88 (+) Transcript_38105:189-452(+)